MTIDKEVMKEALIEILAKFPALQALSVRTDHMGEASTLREPPKGDKQMRGHESHKRAGPSCQADRGESQRKWRET